jgi:hypothetical protein
MRFVCWITKVTDTHTHKIEYLLLFHYNNFYANALQYYVVRTLLFYFFNLERVKTGTKINANSTFNHQLTKIPNSRTVRTMLGMRAVRSADYYATSVAKDKRIPLVASIKNQTCI